MSQPSIEQAVEKRLRKAEKNKKYKDSNRRKGGAKKERVAYDIISYQMLDSLEADAINAARQVTKNKVWPAIDIVAERKAGVESGAVFWKVEMRKAMSSKPFDSADARRAYVKGISILLESLEELKTLEEVRKAGERFVLSSNAEKYIGELDNLANGNRYYVSQDWKIRKKLEGVFGKRFVDFVKLATKSSRDKAAKALLFSPFTKTQQDAYIKEQKNRWLKRIEHLKSTISDKEKLEQSRQYAERKIEQLKDSSNLPTLYQTRKADWSWTEKKTSAKGKKNTGVKVNTKPPLSHIIRTGGIEVPYITSTNIDNVFADQVGFYSIEFGNGLPDAEREQHANRFYQAIIDLEELTGLDIAKLNRYGQLGIGFATRGVSGHWATYFPSYKIINLSRKNGDGSLAHEWSHYLDNILSRVTKNTEKLNGSKGRFASAHGAANPLIDQKMKAIFTYIKQGETEVEITFPAQSKKRYAIYKTVPFDQMVERYQGRRAYGYYNKASKNQKDVWGYIAHLYGKDEITVTLKVKGSEFYTRSMQIGSFYWINPIELFARGFESYILLKQEKTGIRNNYLQDNFHRNFHQTLPYPEGKEAEELFELYEELMQAIAQELEMNTSMDFSGMRVEQLETVDGKGKAEQVVNEVVDGKNDQTGTGTTSQPKVGKSYSVHPNGKVWKLIDEDDSFWYFTDGIKYPKALEFSWYESQTKSNETSKEKFPYEQYSEWSRNLARNHSVTELEKEYRKLVGLTEKYKTSRFNAHDKIHSNASISQAAVQAGNNLRGNYEKKMAYKNAIEIHEHYPESAKKEQKLNNAFLNGKKLILHLPNKETRSAKYAIIEAGKLIASHDERTFASSSGYPLTESGHNINDRNYALDKNAQALVETYARELRPELLITTSKTPAGSPIVTMDGIVVSGNNRTMSIKRAIAEYPERYRAYLDELREEWDAFGFPEGSEVLERYQNPVLVRIDFDFPAYTTQELAKYNQSETKGKRPVDKAIELSQILMENSGCSLGIPRILEQYERMGDFYANGSDQAKMMKMLRDCNLLTEQEISTYYDKATGFTNAGKDFLEATLSAAILGRDAILASDKAGVRKLRRAIVTTLPTLSQNKGLGAGSLTRQINDAVLYQLEIVSSGLQFNDYINQSSLFENRQYSDEAIYLNRLMNVGRNTFKKAIESYNNSVASSTGATMFGDAPKPEEAFAHYIISAVPAKEKTLIERRGGKAPEGEIENKEALRSREIWELTRDEYWDAVFRGEIDFELLGMNDDRLSEVVAVYHETKANGDPANLQIAREEVYRVGDSHLHYVLQALQKEVYVPFTVLKEYPELKKFRTERKEAFTKGANALRTAAKYSKGEKKKSLLSAASAMEVTAKYLTE